MLIYRARCWAALIGCLVLLGSAALVVASTSHAADTPTVGPVVPGEPGALLTTTFDLSRVGYSQSEHFVSGTARSFLPNTPLTTDGEWSLRKADSAAYKTRVITYTPSRQKFNGTVYVDWLNVSGGLDLAEDWLYAHNELIRQGAAVVMVSAQKRGVDNAVAKLPDRYGSLTHPGDSFSYDIFSQVAGTLKTDPSQLLGDLKPRQIIGIGNSQSADRLVTYIDGVQPIENIFDGFFIWSKVGKGGPAAALSQAPQAVVRAPLGTRVRADLVPVLDFWTEWDVESLPPNTVAQPDSPNYRAWHVAGAGHGDSYANYWAEDTGSPQDVRMVAQAMFDEQSHPAFTLAPSATGFPSTFTCPVGINVGVKLLRRRCGAARAGQLGAYAAARLCRRRASSSRTRMTTPAASMSSRLMITASSREVFGPRSSTRPSRS